MGGFVGTVVCTVLYGVLLRFAFGYTVNYLYLALYGALGSAISQMGDLSFPISSGSTESRISATFFPDTAACWTGLTA